LKDVDKACDLPIDRIVLIPVDLMKSVVIGMLSESRQHQSRNYIHCMSKITITAPDTAIKNI
jgi:hypothetical protein